MIPKSSTSIPSMLGHLRRRADMPMSRMQGHIPALTVIQENFPIALAANVGAVVFTARVVTCAVEPLIVTEAGMLHVAGSLAAAGVIAQLREITPVNPFDGVKVMKDVFPADAPAMTMIGVPVMEKPGEHV